MNVNFCKWHIFCNLMVYNCLAKAHILYLPFKNGLKPNPIHKSLPFLNGDFELPPALAGG